MNRLRYVSATILVMMVAACAPDSAVAPAIVRSRIDGSPLDGAILRSLRENPLGCVLFRSTGEEMEFAVVTNRDLGGTLKGSSSRSSLHEVTLLLRSPVIGVIAADCIVDGATSREDLALRWDANSEGGEVIAARLGRLSWHPVTKLRKGLEAREIRHELLNIDTTASGLSLALDPIIVIGYRPPELSDRESAAYDAYCDQYDYYDGEQAMLSDAAESGGGGGSEGSGVDNSGPTDTTTAEDSTSLLCTPTAEKPCDLDSLRQRDSTSIDSSMKFFDTTSNALCKEARDSVQAFLMSGRIRLGTQVTGDGHDGFTNAARDTIHIDVNALDAVNDGTIGHSRLLELLLHEGFHVMGKDHSKLDSYPYITAPFNLTTSGSPPCVKQP